jgi:RNA polymerase sigma factor (sigma-70 family)
MARIPRAPAINCSLDSGAPSTTIPPSMNEQPSSPYVTRPSLLVRLKGEAGESAWAEFVDIYTPLIYGYCRKHGLQDADAADVSQEVMRAVVRAMEKFEYDPNRGKFRGWLLTVVRSKFNNLLASRQRQPQAVGETAMNLLLDQEPTSAEQSDWDAEYQRRVFHWAAERIKPRFKMATWEAFWRTSVEQQDVKEVAESLGLSVGAVYIAKSRVLAQLRDEIRSVDEQVVFAAE